MPGDQLGTERLLASAESQVNRDYPWVKAQVQSLRTEFDRLNANPTEDQVREVLSVLEPCTDKQVEEVLSNPDDRREAAWLLYLSTYGKEGPQKAKQLFKQRE
ncbi:MAG TPA: hypothetical protein VGC58_02255 [Candidatus Paceibacterota bacterium]